MTELIRHYSISPHADVLGFTLPNKCQHEKLEVLYDGPYEFCHFWCSKCGSTWFQDDILKLILSEQNK